MFKIDIKEALYPIQIVFVVYKKFSKTSVFKDRKWPIQSFIAYFECYVIDLSNKIILMSMEITVTPESEGEKGHS